MIIDADRAIVNNVNGTNASPDGSFVATLDIAADDRLRAVRPVVAEAVGADRLRGPATAAPPTFNENLRAAVNAGSLVSFVAGVTEREVSDVLFSTQLAQRAASAQHDRFTATEEWYRVYTGVLNRLGWVGESFAFTQRANAAGSFTMDRSALDVIMTIATGNQLAILVKTIDTLKGLADAEGALRVFELQALRELSGNFQIGAVQRAENGVLSLALGAFYFRTRDARRRLLFVAWGQGEIEFWTGAQKMTLNSALYARHRAAVEAKLNADAADYIAALKLV
jgi:hypothetical protein